jgi:hypothetical protein
MLRSDEPEPPTAVRPRFFHGPIDACDLRDADGTDLGVRPSLRVAS